MIPTVDTQAQALCSWHRLASLNHAQDGLMAAQGERNVVQAYFAVRHLAVDRLRARTVVGRAA